MKIEAEATSIWFQKFVRDINEDIESAEIQDKALDALLLKYKGILALLFYQLYSDGNVQMI